MPGLFGTLYTANSGMRTQQQAIQTTSHNIANVNTPGYSRQRTVTSTSSPYTNPSYTNSIGAGQIGTGVEVTDIERIRNTFYDFQYRSESHKQGQYTVEYEYYKNVENIFNEPSDTGISSSMNKFFSNWQELAKDPNNPSAKNIVIESGKSLTGTISETYKRMDNLEGTIQGEVDRISSDIANILAELEDLNKNIKIVEGAGKTPNDYLDKKDKLLDDLSFKLNIQDTDNQKMLEDAVNASKDSNGKIDLSKLNQEVKDRINSAMSDPTKNISGELQGYKEMKQDINNIKEELKSFANTMTEKINSIYEGEFFVFDSNAKPLIKVHEDLELDATKLNITSNEANLIANSKDEKIDLDGDGTLDKSIRSMYNNILEDIGLKSKEAIRNEQNQKSLINNIDASRTSVTGVSLDEEMVNLIQLQHSYGANAKVLATVDSLLDIVVNGLIR
jgi:flagellar hook-associated protein 1